MQSPLHLQSQSLQLQSLHLKQLPIELINKIINYTGVITFFNGKYYNRMPRSDPRYAMLSEVIKLPKVYSDNTLILDLKKNIGESYNTPRFKLVRIFNAGAVILNVHRCGRKEFYMRSYIFSIENKWYSMPVFSSLLY